MSNSTLPVAPDVTVAVIVIDVPKGRGDEGEMLVIVVVLGVEANADGTPRVDTALSTKARTAPYAKNGRLNVPRNLRPPLKRVTLLIELPPLVNRLNRRTAMCTNLKTFAATAIPHGTPALLR